MRAAFMPPAKMGVTCPVKVIWQGMKKIKVKNQKLKDLLISSDKTISKSSVVDIGKGGLSCVFPAMFMARP